MLNAYDYSLLDYSHFKCFRIAILTKDHYDLILEMINSGVF